MNPELVPIYVLTTLLGVLLVGCFSSLFGSLNVLSGKSKLRSVLSAVIPSGFFGAVIVFTQWTLPGISLRHYAVSCAAMAIMGSVSIFLIVRGNKKRVAAKLSHIFEVSRFAAANFERLAGDQNRPIITADSLHRTLLVRDMSEEDRQAISSVRLHLADIGHKIDDERSYVFIFDKKIQATAITAPIFGATKEELESWPNRYRERNISWLPRAA